MKFKKVIILLFVMVFALVLVGCTGGKEKNGEVPAVSITISGSSQVKLGETSQLRVTLNPANSTSTYTWRSENENIATVNQDGVVYGKELGVAKIVVTTDNGKSKTKVVNVREELEPEYPDLQGYTIRIAHSDNRLYEYDPFYSDDSGTVYRGLNIQEAQRAWSEVEEEFNCTMEVVSYPSDAAWGSARIDYILSQARNNTSQYDFLVGPDTWIPELVQGGGLLDMSEWYSKYGNNFMDLTYITSGTYKGRLYSLTASRADVYNILGYNVNLVKELAKVDSSIKEPAQMFLDDEWDFEKFYEYCKKCQTAMNSLYGEDSGYYAISGWGMFHWIGMVNSSGVSVADTTTMRFNISGDVETAAADLLKRMMLEGMVDPTFRVDGSVQTWNEGHAIFNSGEYWFCNDSLRWKANLWGDGDATLYGYVPWPAMTGTHKEDYRLAVTGGQTFYMPVAKDYTGYGDDCTAENIYYAMITYMQRAEAYYKAREDYDEYTTLQLDAAKLYGSEASIEAVCYINSRASQISYYDPMILESNPVASTYDSDWAKAVNLYLQGVGDSTWAEVVEPYRETLEQSLTRVYG